jgi:pyridoxamine 5'-phosphate oxidase
VNADPRSRPLDEADVDADPLRQFEAWFREAQERTPLAEAAALATATPDGLPSARMVLVKGADEGGFLFHTNYESRKGRELADNPRAALLFYWHALGRQVRVEGTVSRAAREDSEAYFRTRPPRARISAAASRQSSVIAGRAELEARFDELLAEHGADVPLPDYWGGYLLEPVDVEFWQGRQSRLHDRLRYRRRDGGWALERLAP